MRRTKGPVDIIDFCVVLLESHICPAWRPGNGISVERWHCARFLFCGRRNLLRSLGRDNEGLLRFERADEPDLVRLFRFVGEASNTRAH